MLVHVFDHSWRINYCKRNCNAVLAENSAMQCISNQIHISAAFLCFQFSCTSYLEQSSNLSHWSKQFICFPSSTQNTSVYCCFLRAKAECFARLCHRLGVCPSVCLSVTLVDCIKPVQARITKSSLWAAPQVSSLSWQNFVPLGVGVPLERGRQRGVPPLKRCHFAVIGSNNVKTVADRYRHAAYHNKHWWQAFWIYQHRWPWMTLNLPKRGF